MNGAGVGEGVGVGLGVGVGPGVGEGVGVIRSPGIPSGTTFPKVAKKLSDSSVRLICISVSPIVNTPRPLLNSII